jgi:hypothetical protein
MYRIFHLRLNFALSLYWFLFFICISTLFRCIKMQNFRFTHSDDFDEFKKKTPWF